MATIGFRLTLFEEGLKYIDRNQSQFFKEIEDDIRGLDSEKADELLLTSILHLKIS